MESTVKSTLKRRDACFLLCMAIAGGVIAFVTSAPLYVRISSALFLLIAPVFFYALLFPERCMSGVRMRNDGFDFHASLRAPQFVRFADIRLIEAISSGGGPQGDDVPFVIHSIVGKVLVQESDLFQTRLFERLKELPGFDSDAYVRAANYDLKGLEIIFGKRFVVYEQRTA